MRIPSTTLQVLFKNHQLANIQLNLPCPSPYPKTLKVLCIVTKVAQTALLLSSAQLNKETLFSYCLQGQR